MRAISFVLPLAFALAACCGRPPAPPPTGTDVAAACARWKDLKCHEADPTPDGKVCEQWVRAVNDSGVAPIDTACVARARSCDEASRCHLSK